MIFNSYLFIFVFLPCFIAGWFLLNKKNNKFAKVFLILMSVMFCGYAGIKGLILILLSGVFNYFISFLYTKASRQKLLMVIAVLANVIFLFYFKYFNFFVSNINAVFKSNLPMIKMFMPIGISFYSFRQIMFVVDRYKGEISHCKLIDYLGYLLYFPILAQGPISDYSVIEKGISEDNKINYDNVVRGFLLFILGLTKKVLLADNLGLLVDKGYKYGRLDTFVTIIVSLAYTFQIYFDFSGYCDMAMGVGKMMNLDVPLNFDSPYKAVTVRDFWKRWHITLNQFFTKYLYIPLGGSKKGSVRKVINTLIVFLVSGLWHGANFTFILWGLLHGIGVILSPKNVKGKIKYILTPITFIYVNLAWILFRSSSISEALKMYKNIFMPFTNNSIHEVSRALDIALVEVPVTLIKKVIPGSERYIFIVFMIVFILLAFAICFGKNAYKIIEDYTIDSKKITIWIFAILFVLDVLTLSDTASFIYTNF